MYVGLRQVSNIFPSRSSKQWYHKGFSLQNSLDRVSQLAREGHNIVKKALYCNESSSIPFIHKTKFKDELNFSNVICIMFCSQTKAWIYCLGMKNIICRNWWIYVFVIFIYGVFLIVISLRYYNIHDIKKTNL